MMENNSGMIILKPCTQKQVHPNSGLPKGFLFFSPVKCPCYNTMNEERKNKVISYHMSLIRRAYIPEKNH